MHADPLDNTTAAMVVRLPADPLDNTTAAMVVRLPADPLDNTTAAMVVRLPADPAVPAVAWTCLGSPCVSAFLPCYLEGAVPARLACGGGDPDPGSPWWGARTLLSLVERDFARFARRVRARFDDFEAGLAGEASAIEAEVEGAWRAGRMAEGAVHLGDFM